MSHATAEFPLGVLLPALREIPRVSLCVLPSPVVVAAVDGADVWIKSDGKNAEVCGGNKVRALEFLLAGLRPGETVLTTGGEGSTHVLATAIHARRMGARTIALRWRHEMNPAARKVAAMIVDECVMSRVYNTTAGALLRAQLMRLSQNVRYVPIGGSTPLGILGHVNAALELAAQVRNGELPAPRRVVVPLGTGGTVAGLALGLALAGLETATIAVQVTPSIVANGFRVRRLIARTARFIERFTSERVPPVREHLLGIVHDAYGGAYGRPLPAAQDAARALERITSIRLDDTYSAKAFVVAHSLARSDAGPTLFWDTFDSRLL